MGPKLLVQKAIEQVDHCLKHVKAVQLDDPTPCTEWNLRQLLNHMTYEALWIPDMVRGKTIAEVGDRYDGDQLGDDPADAWRHAAIKALEAVRDANEDDVSHLSYGDVSVHDYLTEVGGDIFLHNWDVGQALHCSVIFDEPMASYVYDNLLPRSDELRLSGLYGKQIAVADDADLQTKLLALVGRSAEKWLKSLAL